MKGVESNRCFSKTGSKVSQMFSQLKVKNPGDLNVLRRHESTHKLMLDKDERANIKEESLKA